jgi:hypothetical protein
VTIDNDFADIGLLTAVIARSQIVVLDQAQERPGVPQGFEDVDIAILDWIAAEVRGAARHIVRM